MIQKEEKQRASNHYAYYPEDEQDIPAYLAYGFRPVFLFLAPYMIIIMILWGLVWSDILSIPFMNDILTWHIYEMLFGVLTSGTMAFLTTGLPELFPGMVPFVGRRLLYIMGLWIAGRISFWTIDITGVWLTAILNLSMLAWIIWFAKDTVLDRLQRHASLGYTIIGIFMIECWFFASKLGFVSTNSIDILKISVGALSILILLALRRVNMEAVNEYMEDNKIDDVYISRPPKTNLAIFTIVVFTIVEFFYPSNSILGWLGLACGAAILGVTSDYKLQDKFILHLPYVWYLGAIPLLMAAGYILMGWDLLDESIYGINHFRHFITSGAIGLSYLMVMIIISWIHTGRKLVADRYSHLMVGLMIFATVLRSVIPFYEQYSFELYLYSSILWTLPFIIYIKVFYKFLFHPRADGIKG